MPPKYRNADWLEARYHGDGWTQREMADACGVSPTTVREWMKRHDIETRDLKGENHPLYGESRDELVRERISERMEGREFAEETRRKISEANKGREIEEDTKRKISESLTGHTRSDRTRRRMSESTAGPDNPNWRGGYSSRYGGGWATAREQALERDGACQHCGHDGGKTRLEVHHIIPVRRFRESPDADLKDAHELSNLVTLCKRCHPKAEHGKLNFESGVEPP